MEQLESLLRRIALRARRLVDRAGPEPDAPQVQTPLLNVYGAEPSEPSSPELVARFDGFNLHAGTAFESHERVAIERFCRSALRGLWRSGGCRRPSPARCSSTDLPGDYAVSSFPYSVDPNVSSVATPPA
jgi:hypothetical protein